MQRLIWSKSNNIIFPIIVVIFYYWSMAGSWFFLLDQSTHWGERIGLHYHYLLEKMFMVQIDTDYLLSIWIIGVFILLLQASQLFFLTKFNWIAKTDNKHESGNDIYFSIIAFIFLLFSLYIVKDIIGYSLILNESVYLNIRSPHVPNYSLHQLACWIMMIALTIPLSNGLRNHIKYGIKFSFSPIYWSIFILAQFYLIFIGSRHEAFLCGLCTLLYISYPSQKIQTQWRTYTSVITVWIMILFLNDPMRSLSPIVGKKLGITTLLSNNQKINESNIFREDRTFIAHRDPLKSAQLIEERSNRDTTFNINGDKVTIKIKDFEAQRKIDQEFIIVADKKYKIPNPHISKAYQESGLAEKIYRAITGIIFSNELFAGHFSMYGAIHYNIPINIGISFKNLFYSFIPSFIKKERPQDVYGYYAEQLHLPKDQGFTINHIAAWYINLGWFGIIIGPILLAILMLSPFIIGQRFWSILPPYSQVFIFVLITCFGAMLVRCGPEGTKSILYEAIIIPLGLIWSFTLYTKVKRTNS